MPMPTDDLTTASLDAFSDDPSQARVEIYNAILKIKAIIAAYDVASGLAPLNAAGTLPDANIDGPAVTALLSVATTSAKGLLSTTDKTKLDSLAAIYSIGPGLSLASNVLSASALSKIKSATVTTTTTWANFKSANSISDNVTTVGVFVAGGGGGGGGGASHSNAGYPGASGGGGASGVAVLGFGTPSGTITIGAGGTGGAGGAYPNNGGANGGAGGTSTFAGISAAGGSYGYGASPPNSSAPYNSSGGAGAAVTYSSTVFSLVGTHPGLAGANIVAGAPSYSGGGSAGVGGGSAGGRGGHGSPSGYPSSGGAGVAGTGGRIIIFWVD